jgi:hypothetical protein
VKRTEIVVTDIEQRTRPGPVPTEPAPAAEPIARVDPRPEPEPEPDRRSPAEIEADIARTRERLAGTLDVLADRVKPSNVARRGVARVRSRLLTEDGRPRPAPLAVAGGLTAVTIGLVLLRRRGGT